MKIKDSMFVKHQIIKEISIPESVMYKSKVTLKLFVEKKAWQVLKNKMHVINKSVLDFQSLFIRFLRLEFWEWLISIKYWLTFFVRFILQSLIVLFLKFHQVFSMVHMKNMN